MEQFVFEGEHTSKLNSMHQDVNNIVKDLNGYVNTNQIDNIYQALELLSNIGVKLTYLDSEKFLELKGREPSFTKDFIHLREKIKRERIEAGQNRDYRKAGETREVETSMDRNASQICSLEMFSNSDLFNVLSPYEVAYVLPKNRDESSVINIAIRTFFTSDGVSMKHK